MKETHTIIFNKDFTKVEAGTIIFHKKDGETISDNYSDKGFTLY